MAIHSTLIIDDQNDFRSALCAYFDTQKISTTQAATCSQARSLLAAGNYDFLMLDIRLPDGNGLELLQEMKEQYPQVPVVLMSGYGDMDIVLQALRYGAVDFLRKPFHFQELRTVLDKVEQLLNLSRNVRKTGKQYIQLADNLDQEFRKTLISASPAMNRVLELVTRIAFLDQTDILLSGESGVGKEVVAQAIHSLSNRRNEIFYAMNCSAIPESLFESEIFGHSKSAFTGAAVEKAGAFEAANGGFLFLDEICSLPINMQAKLLRVLEERKIRRLGSNKSIPVNVRIISASNSDLKKMVEEGQFRSDLYHRLNTFEITIPPLRERKEDILPLCEHFCLMFAEIWQRPKPAFSPEVLQAMHNYAFPGNIRELKNMVRKAVILSNDTADVLHLPDFPDLMLMNNSAKPAISSLRFEPLHKLDEVEKSWIENALHDFKYNFTKTAAALGITRQALNRKMEKYNIPAHNTLTE
jgi:DNA-binding NtrC family response regulator